MKTLLILLISFNSFSQDTCACTRLDKRLRHDLDKYAIKLFDDQHKRENTKEIKRLRFEKRTFVNELKLAERMYNDRLDFVTDSLERVSETKLRIASDSTNLVKLALKKSHRAAIRSERKRVNWNVVIWLVGIVVSLGFILAIVMRVKK